MLVGVGAISQREEDPSRAREPLALMIAALERAAEDAGCRALLARADSIRAPRGFWDYPDPCRLARRALRRDARADRDRRDRRAADDVARARRGGHRGGRADVVLVAGAEARHRALRAKIAGVDAPLTKQAPTTPDTVLRPHAPILSRAS